MTSIPETAGMGSALRIWRKSWPPGLRRDGWKFTELSANPHAAELLAELSAQYPISVHTVGISVGSARGIDRLHLQRIRELVDKIRPIFVSGHLAWSTYGVEYLNDLLPLPYNEETLQIVSAHINEVQNTLGVPYLIENPASYVGFSYSTMKETEFLRKLVQRTGCQLLLDVSNVVVSAHNMGFDAHQYIDDFPGDAIGEMHLGGFTPEEDEATPGAEVWIDTHAAAIAERCLGCIRIHASTMGCKADADRMGRRTAFACDATARSRVRRSDRSSYRTGGGGCTGSVRLSLNFGMR